MNTCVCLVLLLFAVQSALAAVWDGQLFNYQLGELFDAQTSPLPVGGIADSDGSCSVRLQPVVLVTPGALVEFA